MGNLGGGEKFPQQSPQTLKIFESPLDFYIEWIDGDKVKHILRHKDIGIDYLMPTYDNILITLQPRFIYQFLTGENLVKILRAGLDHADYFLVICY